jgi:hypothetical protein
VSPIFPLKFNITTIKGAFQEAEIIDTTEETVEKVQICSFANFKDNKIK